MPFERSSGLLLHITSLPSNGGIGDFGPEAYKFADFLAAGKQKFWQVLPLSPVGYGNSPYAALSAFAGNPLLISLERLTEWGWIDSERAGGMRSPSTHIDFGHLEKTKLPLIYEAAETFLAKHDSLKDQGAQQWARFGQYRIENRSWLNDWAAYNVLRRKFGTAAWHQWPRELARREPGAMQRLWEEEGHALAVEQVIQFAFDEQWRALREYCAARKVRFIGDVAIFVSYDSADVWTHPDLFELDENLQPERVSGVPPDYFSATGQRWGNPLYKWDVLEQRGFDWWVERIGRARTLYDVIRLDHFRGFEAYWAIPARDDTAVNGRWVKAPGAALFTRLREVFGDLPFIAEDLGMITKEVHALREEFGLPGMRILQFAFSDRGAHNYLPHRFVPNTVVYTGTHDNNTTKGWWEKEATDNEKAAVHTYLGPEINGIVWPLIRVAAASIADICLFPLQDVLELGADARMNVPSKPADNWAWRYKKDALEPVWAERLAALMEVTDRDDYVAPEE